MRHNSQDGSCLVRLQFGGLLLRVDSMADNDETFADAGNG